MNNQKGEHRARPPELIPTARATILPRLGIYGMDQTENPFLAGLLSREPILLIGPHGSAKTALARAFAAALGLKFGPYEASKSLFEDLIGFPDPSSLADGHVRYARTPLSIFDKEFILIEEISRATPGMQNKWLEVVRSHSMMGLPITSIKHVVAAMNPPTGDYPGAIPLDVALAGRFGFIITMPTVAEMCREDVLRIIRTVGHEDSPAFDRTPTENAGLKELLARAASRLREMEAYFDALARYVEALRTALMRSKICLDGRRLGMIYRNLICYLSVVSAKGELARADTQALRKPLFDAVRFSMPHAAYGPELPRGILLAAHLNAIEALSAGGLAPASEARLAVDRATNPIDRVDVYLRVAGQLGRLDHEHLVTGLAEGLAAGSDPAEAARSFVGLKRLVAAYQAGEVEAPPDAVSRATALLLEASTVAAADASVCLRGATGARDVAAAAIAARLGGGRKLSAPHPGNGGRQARRDAEVRERFEKVKAALMEEEATA